EGVIEDSRTTIIQLFFFFQAEDGIRDGHVTGVQTCALPIFDLPLRVRRRAELEEEGRQRVIARYENPAPTQVVRETVITKEVVLIQCRHCGARYPQGTVKCLTCGANL